jgi:hypothetical protein
LIFPLLGIHFGPSSEESFCFFYRLSPSLWSLNQHLLSELAAFFFFCMCASTAAGQKSVHKSVSSIRLLILQEEKPNNHCLHIALYNLAFPDSISLWINEWTLHLLHLDLQCYCLSVCKIFSSWKYFDWVLHVEKMHEIELLILTLLHWNILAGISLHFSYRSKSNICCGIFSDAFSSNNTYESVSKTPIIYMGVWLYY